MLAGSAGKLACAAVVLAAAALFAVVLSDAAWTRADLVIGNGPDPRSLDPALTSAIADGRILTSLFEGLVALDPETSRPVPAMAASWDKSADGLDWTFRLRVGLRWSDGRPIVAQDLAWSFVRFLSPATGARGTDLLDAVRNARAFTRGSARAEDVGIAAPDARTLAFRLERPAPCFLDLLALFPLYPVPRHRVEAHGRAWTRAENFAGNGPFRLVAWRIRDRVRVERNPFYWDAANVPLGTIDWLCLESATTRLNLYLSGAADVVTDVPPATIPALLERFGPAATGEFQPAPRLATFFFRVNTAAGALRNARIRRALSLAIDREAIVGGITRAGERPALSFVPPGTRCGEETYQPPRALAGDPAGARRLLAEGLREEGLAALPLFEVLYSPEPTDQAIAEYLQHAWSGLGVACRLVNLDTQSLLDRLRKRDYAVARSSWIGDFADPSTFLDQFASQSAGNRTGWSDPRYDELVLDEAPRAPTDAARAALLRAAEERLLEASPLIPVFHNASRALVKPRVRGWTRNPLDWHPARWLRVEGGP